MTFVKISDGTRSFCKDWGSKDAQPNVLHHGGPLNADGRDAQMLFSLLKVSEPSRHGRRGHGRSTQVSGRHDMDHYVTNASAATEHLDLKNAVHVGHSTDGGPVARHVAKHGQPQMRESRSAALRAHMATAILLARQGFCMQWHHGLASLGRSP